MASITLTAVFNTPGAFTWQPPPGVTSAIVVAWGAGGAGGDAGTTSGSTGGGAGAGECACEPALGVTPGIVYSGFIGTGGLGSATGVQGGTDTFFTGDGGVQVYAHGGGGGSTSPTGGGAAGLGGTGSSNTFVGTGGSGAQGVSSATSGWSLVQQSAAQTSNGTNTLPAPSTQGNLLVAVVGSGSNTPITAPAGWGTAISEVNGTINETQIFPYFNNPGGLSSFTFAGPANIWVTIMEFTCSSVAAVSATSDSGVATAGAVASDTIATAGTAVARDLVIIGAFEHLNAASAITWTDPTGFTQSSGLLIGSNPNHSYSAYDLSASSSGVQSVTATSSVASTLATGWSGVVATFSPPASGGGGGGAGGVTAVADSRLPLMYPAQGWAGNAGSGSTAGAASSGTFPGGAGGAGSTSGAGTGANGVAPGGGGGGSLSTGTGRNGGNGANGQVTITWTMTDPVTISTNTLGGVYSYQSPVGGSSVLAQAWGAGGGGFNTTPGGSGGHNGLVGGTLPPSCLQTGAYDAGLTQEQADSFFVQLVGRGNGTHLTVTKKFWNLSDWSTSKNNLQNYVAHGTKVIMALKPAYTPGSTSGPHGGNGTSADVTNLSNFLKAIALLGFTSTNCEIVFWQEPANSQNVQNPTDYGLIIKSYGPTVNASVAADGQPFKLVVNVNYVGGGSVSNATDYANAALGLRGFVSTGTTISAIAMDFYTNSYMNQGSGTIKKLLDTQDGNGDSISGIADTAGIPFGLNEFGAHPTDYTQPQVTQYFNYLISFFTARLSAGKTNWNMVYYDGEGSPTGVGLITSPLSQDPSTGTQIGSTPVPSYSDYRVALYQQVYDSLTTASSSLGGAGGGGGEFASEAALALNDSAIYTFAIGAGNPLQTGGNTTIAGQSVTVTAHGGGVATATTAGGIGGTGSGNTTAHPGGAGGAGGGATGGGGGGGGSGGTAASGNAGHAGTSIAGGAGGAAVTGGGAGGRGGNPSHDGFSGASPGGAGGGSGSNDTGQGDGSDGQIVLSGFVTHPAGISAYQLGALAWSATGSVQSPGNWALGALAFSGTGQVSMFNFVQQGPASTGPFTLPAASTPGNLLLAVVVQSTQSASTPPAGAGWTLVQAQNTSGASGRLELWYLNDLVGGTSSVTWTGGTALRGNLYEFAPPPGYIAQVDGTPGSTGFAAGTTSFHISMSLPTASDLLFSCFEDQFSSNPSGSSWTKPGGWIQGVSISQNVPDEFVGYYKLGVNASGTQNVTGVFSTSTSQVGAAGIIAGFTAIPTVGGSSGQMALGPLSWGGIANSVVTGVQTSGGWALGGLSWQSPSEAVTFPQDPLPIRVELLINGAWADISNYVYQRDGISIMGRGRPDEASTAQPTTLSLTLDARDGSFNPYNTSGQFYPFLTRNTQIRLSIINAVTPNGAWYNGTRFIGEVPSWPPQWDPSQTDIYVQIQAVGVLQRMRQSKFLASPLKRYYANLTGSLIPAAYWPTEDGTAATNFASGIPGGSEMFWTGTPGLAADTSVAGSAAFATLSSSVWTGIPGSFSAGGQTFNTPGTFQWLCPSGITTIQVVCVGGGGGGQDGANSSGNGGGGGELAQHNTLAVTPGKLYTLVVGTGGSGGAGAFAPPSHASANNGSNGQNSTFTGDSFTVIAHGGGGATNSGGNGGSGSNAPIHHNGGNGANSGSGFGGGGGGGSGGTSGTGNNGHNNSGTVGGAGAASVAGGGPGGLGGTGATAAQGNVATPGNMPTAGPGGGGGGGGFNSSDNYDKPGGNGFAGQVQIIFGLTQVPAPPAIALRLVVDSPSSPGGIDGSVMGEVDCDSTGTLATMQIIYHTANSGSFQLKATKTSGGGTLFDSGTVAFGNNGKPVMVSAELTATPSGTTVNWKLTGIFPGATSVVTTKTGSYTGSLSGVTEFRSNNGTLDTGTTGVGHVAVQYAIDPILNLSQAFNGYIGELAATRFMRLCGEQQVPVTLFGSVTDTPQMGPQPVDILVNLLQDCENVDLGMMFERRAIFGLAYVTRSHMQNQNPSCVLDYSLNQIVLPLQPTDDDALTRNDIIATRGTSFATGSSFEVQDTSGPMSINDPPNGVGLYQYSVTANLFADTQLPNFAAWILILGTVDEFRYPIITIDMTRIQVSDGTFQAVAGLDIGNFLQIINVPVFLQNPINQLCFGFAEVMNAFEWTISVNAVPEDPWTGDSLPVW